MIRGVHGLLYSTDPKATRAFFRDKVKLPGSDVGDGWWIFDFPEGDLGVHPVEDPSDAGAHDVSFYCDDIEGTVRELKSRGVRFMTGISDHGYGLVTYFHAPGGIKIQLYEPRYVKGTSARSAAAKARAAKPRPVSKSKTSKKRVVRSKTAKAPGKTRRKSRLA